MTQLTDDQLDAMTPEQLKYTLRKTMEVNLQVQEMIKEVQLESTATRRQLVKVISQTLALVEDLAKVNPIASALLHVHMETLRNMKILLL